MGKMGSIIAAISHRFDWLTYTTRHGLCKGMKRKGGLGFLPEWLVGQQETAEDGFFRKLDLRGKVVYDVGAFQGLTALFFSRTAKMVIAFEPNPLNCAHAFQNILANRLSNVFLLNVAIDERRGELPFFYEDNFAGRGSADPTIVARTVALAPSTESLTVPAVSLDEIVRAGFPPPDFIKIDVEGMEMRVLRGAEEILRACHPVLCIEIHGVTVSDKKRNANEVVELLGRRSYSDLYHVESGARITGENAPSAREGHLYCR